MKRGRILKNPSAHTATTEQDDDVDDIEERRNPRKAGASDQIPPQSKPPPSKKSKKDDDGGAQQGANAARSGPNAASSSSAQPKQSSKAQMSSNQLSMLYNQVLKLSSENKINLKTTWTLPLIEHLDEIVLGNAVVEDDDDAQTEAPTLQGAPNFQRASVTIDASMKIYSTRVDSVHTATLHMAGGIEEFDRDDGDASQGPGAADGGDAADADRAQKKKHRERTERGTNTLEDNIQNLNAKKFDLEFAVDPLFRKTSAAFEAGGTRGLLLNHLSVQNGREIIFDSADAVREDEPGVADLIPASSGQLDLGFLQGIIKSSIKTKKKLEDMEICPDYADFKFRSNNAEDERITEPDLVDIQDDEVNDDFELEDIPDNLGDAEFPNDLEDQESRLQQQQREMAFPVAVPEALDIEPPLDDDDSHHMGGNMPMDIDIPDDAPARRSPRRKSLGGAGGPAVDMFDLAVENPLLKDYTYFDPNKLNGWSGPQHWKYKHTFQKKKSGDLEDGEDGVTVAEAAGLDKERMNANSKSAGAKERSRVKKAAFSIDFSKPMSDDEFGKLFDDRSKTSTTLSKGTLNQSEKDAKSLTLAADVGYDSSRLLSLFLKPSTQIIRRRGPADKRAAMLKTTSDSPDDDNDSGGFLAAAANIDDDYDHDAPVDIRDDEPNVFANEPMNVDAGIGASQMEPGLGFSASQLMGTQAPPVIATLELKPQKLNETKIDYARQDKKIDVKQLKRAIWKDLCVSEDETGKVPDSMAQPKGFQDVLNLLPNDINRATLQQVSVPYCFVCLLHLANEKHLNLSAENLDTLIIKQTPEGSDVPQADINSVLFAGSKRK